MLIIAECINSNTASIRNAIESRDKNFISDLAVFLTEHGSDYIDVNVSSCRGIEKDNMLWAIETLRSRVNTPLSIDSTDPKVVRSALEYLDEKETIINSITGDPRLIEEIFPLALERECFVIALAMDEKGIPKTPDGRLEVCSRINEEAKVYGLGTQRILFDPLVRPVSVDENGAMVALLTLEKLKREMEGARTVVGLSNISYGLPSRALINAAFLSIALYLGLDAALLDPSQGKVISMIKATEAILGLDPYCREYICHYRKYLKEQDRI